MEAIELGPGLNIICSLLWRCTFWKSIKKPSQWDGCYALYSSKELLCFVFFGSFLFPLRCCFLGCRLLSFSFGCFYCRFGFHFTCLLCSRLQLGVVCNYTLISFPLQLGRLILHSFLHWNIDNLPVFLPNLPSQDCHGYNQPYYQLFCSYSQNGPGRFKGVVCREKLDRQFGQRVSRKLNVSRP